MKFLKLIFKNKKSRPKGRGFRPISKVKATRVKIHLGDIPLNVYQLPDGSYRLAGRNVTDAIDEAANSLLRKMGVKSLKALPHKDLSLLQVRADTGETFIPVSIEDAVTYWTLMAQSGNQKSLAILSACAVEAIERRADHALGVLVSEDFRNAKMKARIDSILQRHFWTDSIKWYLDNTPGLDDKYKTYVYATVSDTLNVNLFGMTAKQIRETYSIPAGDLLRDHVDPEYLPDISFIEKYAGTKVKKGTEPVRAINEALSFIGIEPRPFKSELN